MSKVFDVTITRTVTVRVESRTAAEASRTAHEQFNHGIAADHATIHEDLGWRVITVQPTLEFIKKD